MLNKKRGQIWIETVLYTLIGMTLIGVVLAFVTPKINESKDRLLIEQNIQALNAIDEKVTAVLTAPGNVRQLDFAMKKGAFYINSTQDVVIFVIEGLNKPYSEPEVEIEIGKIKLLTTKNQDSFTVRLKTTYAENLVYDLQNQDKKFDAVSLPYRFSVSNEGVLASGRTTINVRELSGT